MISLALISIEIQMVVTFSHPLQANRTVREKSRLAQLWKSVFFSSRIKAVIFRVCQRPLFSEYHYMGKISDTGLISKSNSSLLIGFVISLLLSVCLWSKTNWESNLWYLPIWSDLMCQQWKLSWLFQWYFIGNNPRSINYYALAKKSTPIVNEKLMSQIYFFELWVFWNPWPQISSLEEKENAMKYQNVSESIDQTDETESLLSIF